MELLAPHRGNTRLCSSTKRGILPVSRSRSRYGIRGFALDDHLDERRRRMDERHEPRSASTAGGSPEPGFFGELIQSDGLPAPLVRSAWDAVQRRYVDDATRALVRRHGKPVAFDSDQASTFHVNAQRPRSN